MNRRRISKQKSASTGYVIGAMLFVVTEAARKVCRVGNKQKRGKYERRVRWYQDVRLWLLLIVVIFIISISLMMAKPSGERDSDRLFFAETTADIIFETTPETEGEVPSVNEEAIALARLADSVAKGRNDDVKRIVMWVAINRSEDRSHGYGRSLLEEISRPKQWQEYSENASYLEATVELAEEVLATWRAGGPRPLYGDMLWFVLNGDGSITVRNQFREAKNRSESTFGQ